MSAGRALRTVLLASVALGFLPAPSLAVEDEASRLFEVTVESARRTTAGGDTVAYDLYVPKAASGMPEPPWPALVLNHGFARSKEHLANNARYLAERGIVVLTPNLVDLFDGEKAQLAAIADTRDHVAWLKKRAETAGDPLHGMIDPGRFALAGHSAGGAVAFEAAVASPDVRALVLLDAVPWGRTIALAPQLKTPKLASLRSEPMLCNSLGNVRDLLAKLPFRNGEVRIVGGSHCDPENPTDIWCRLACRGTSAGPRDLYQRLLYLFLQDALPVPPVEEPPDSWEKAIDRGVRNETLVVRTVGSGQETTTLFDVDVENGTRTTAGGTRLAYSLFVPKVASGQPAPPWPAVVLNHGFARSKKFHAGTARHLAERGFVVLTPDLVNLVWGESAQKAAIADTRDHVAWLKKRAGTAGDRLHGLLDPARIALAGHSAGGAVAFEAAEGESGISAVVLLDAVPWQRTLDTAKEMKVQALASLRSEPSGCNADGSVTRLLPRLSFPTTDVRIVDGTHCDPEDPTDAICRLFCGGTSAGARQLYQSLFTLHLQDALDAPPVERPPDSWEEAIRRGILNGTLVVERVNPAPGQAPLPGS